MKCPHCTHSIHFEATQTYAYCEGEEAGHGRSVTSGFCPHCDGLIVLLEHGLYSPPDEHAYCATVEDVHTVDVLYPKAVSREPLPPEVPEPYRADFTEAASVLALSPKASAAMSRRLLQQVLQNEFRITAGSLAAEIDQFIHRPGVPSHLTGAVDAVRNVGNFAAHPLKDTHTGTIVGVEPGEAEWLLEVLEALFDFTFVQPKRLETRKKQLDAKLASLGKPAMKT
jgi:hypothetical protein